MNKPKLSIAAASRVLLNVFLVIFLVVLASLIGVGGAALWIYGRPEAMASITRSSSPRLKSDLAANEARTFPKLSPVAADDDTPAQLTPARYVPTDSEIATLSDTPRYTYVSYNGGRQQAHLRVNTVLADSAPAPLTVSSTDDVVPPVQIGSRPPLSDSASHYITDAQGRVIGVDGTASAAAEARAQQLTVARAIPVQSANVTPEVRVAAPVVTRKAIAVDSEEVSAAPGTFDVQTELAKEDERPVLHAQPVNRTVRRSIFGASDNFRTFGQN